MDVYQQSLKLHEDNRGKLGVAAKVPINERADLTLAYTPGVAEPCRKIAANKDDVYKYTMKANSVAVITEGSAVLGLGNIGAEAGLPVMEGKCLLFKKFGGIDAVPICVKTQNVEEFVMVVKNITATFGGINLEDIAAPTCFAIEERLKDVLDIPVFHDDQHGTAIVVLAGLINAFKLCGHDWATAKVVISGAGAAGVAVTKLLLSYGLKNVIVCDRSGAIYPGRADISPTNYKYDLARITNPNRETGTLADVLVGAQAFIGVSAPNLVNTEMVKKMAPKSIVFAMANPTPEIMPDDARAGGAYVIGTGRSDFPNQINNVLAFPGIFRGVFDARDEIHKKTGKAPKIQITEKMKLAASIALAEMVKNPTPDKVIPGIFEDKVSENVALAVKTCALQ